MATETTTETATPTTLHVDERSFPLTHSLDLSQYPKLSKAQAGHLRHFHNLASQIDGEWKHMGTQEPAQEFLDAYRYQLATMAYASGAAHYHHMPALRSVFKPLMRRLIHKMLRREVWGYWFNTSHSGKLVDPSLTELRQPWADPIKRENIMYSGHLLLMTSLYAMLFDDDEFEKEGSLVFNWNPLFWGLGPERFVYDNRSVQKAILEEMEKNEWMGVCCEPNLVFVVCNQFPLIAMRYNDSRDGTNVVDEVLSKYEAAWKKKTMVADTGLIHDWWAVKQDSVMTASDVGFTAWANAFMNTWNSETVYAGYDKQAFASIVTPTNEKTIMLPPAVSGAFRELVAKHSLSPTEPDTISAARSAALSNPRLSSMPYAKPTFGYVVKWLSELGKAAELNDLLEYADKNLKPRWENGGLYYERYDGMMDEEGNWKHMDPFTGNSAIGYSRLNVKDGQKIMWEKPWTREKLKERPWVDTKGLESGVDFLRGCWSEKDRAILVTMRSWNGEKVSMPLKLRGVAVGEWRVYLNGKLREVQHVTPGEAQITIEVEVGGEETDVVVVAV